MKLWVSWFFNTLCAPPHPNPHKTALCSPNICCVTGRNASDGQPVVEVRSERLFLPCDAVSHVSGSRRCHHNHRQIWRNVPGFLWLQRMQTSQGMHEFISLSSHKHNVKRNKNERKNVIPAVTSVLVSNWLEMRNFLLNAQQVETKLLHCGQKSGAEPSVVIVAFFVNTVEFLVLQTLIQCIEEQNVDGYTEAVREYDSISRLEQWYTTLLLRIKKNIEGDVDLR